MVYNEALFNVSNDFCDHRVCHSVKVYYNAKVHFKTSHKYNYSYR